MRFGKKCLFLALSTLLLLSFFGADPAGGEAFLVDYRENKLIVGDAEYPVPEGASVLVVRDDQGVVVELIIIVDDAVTRVELAGKEFSLTESAEAFLAASPETAAPEAEEGGEKCPECGQPLSAGNHEKLKCGHYRCVVGDNHPTICAHCRRYMCNRANHFVKCAVCGNFLCTKDHRENCSAKASEGRVFVYPGVFLSPYGRSSLGPGSEETKRLLDQLEHVVRRIGELEAKETLTDKEKAELADLRSEYEDVCKKLYGQ